MTSPDALDALLDELSQQGEDTTQAQAGALEPAYANVRDWVQDWLLPTVERRVAEGSRGGVYWCASWWAHPEGLQRIYCLWREWEKARLDDTMSIWWRDHLDPHLNTLTGENGAFIQCSPARHYEPSLLAARPIPQAIVDLLPEAQVSADPASPGAGVTRDSSDQVRT
jgi:Domain of unknown function (DUF4913)